MFCHRQPVARLSGSTVAAVLVTAMVILAGCGGSADQDATSEAGPASASGRSSGNLAYSDNEELSPRVDPEADLTPGPVIDDQGETEPTIGPQAEAAGGEARTAGFVPEARPDGIELVFQDGSLGPARLGSTIQEIGEALGPLYTVTPEVAIRADFPSGYSVARAGEVLFWVIEEDGKASIFMTNSARVGLDSGLRPKMALADAIGLHGEPSFTIGPESREFATFEDGTGAGSSLSILVAIGQFGGPVGVYEQNLAPGAEATGYQSEEANVKELWFWHR